MVQCGLMVTMTNSDVLVVDDDAAILEMVGAALEMEGLPYRTARDGESALELVQDQRPALILLDMNMPVMDGLRFCTALDAGLGRSDTAIIVMTASRDAPRFRQECAATDVLGKPFDLDDLYAVVGRYISAS
jgi:CheY-like chemotaxis protein